MTTTPNSETVATVPAPLNVTRLAYQVLSICGNKEATHKLREDKLRRLEAEQFLSDPKNLFDKKGKRRDMKALRHKFEQKFPLT